MQNANTSTPASDNCRTSDPAVFAVAAATRIVFGTLPVLSWSETVAVAARVVDIIVRSVVEVTCPDQAGQDCSSETAIYRSKFLIGRLQLERDTWAAATRRTVRGSGTGFTRRSRLARAHCPPPGTMLVFIMFHARKCS
jgi:hypothetical protein